jgi:hypothetical protein
MSLTDLAGLLLAVAGVIVAGALMSGAPAAFEALFRSPLELGWPVGVQEDDDMQWSWRSEGSQVEQAESGAEAEAEAEAPFEVRPTRIHPRVGRR